MQKPWNCNPTKFSVLTVYKGENISKLCFYLSAPPSYSECVSGPVTQEGGEDEDDNSAPLAGWTPAYPVYDYTAQTNQVNASMPPTAPPAYDEIQFSNIR